MLHNLNGHQRNANKAIVKYHYTLTKMAIIKITNKTKFVKTMDSQEFSHIADGCITLYNHAEKLALLSTKVDTHFQHSDPSISHLGIYPAETCATSPIQKFQSRIIHNIPELDKNPLTVMYIVIYPYNGTAT